MARRRSRKEPALPDPASIIWPALPNWPGLLTPIIANAFDELNVSVSLWLFGDFWHPIHVVPNVSSFELHMGVVSRRWEYNQRCFDRVHRERQIVRAEHAGFHDLFVPVLDARKVRGIFVTGPFAKSRPTSAEVLERWLALSGSPGRLGDPSFSQYLSTTLSTLTLEGELAGAFERLMTSFARLVVGHGDCAALAAEADAQRKRLTEARVADQMWAVTRAMVDEQSSQAWPEHAHMTLSRLGLTRVPEHVVVGLLLGRRDEADPIDDRLRRDAFQRACVGLSRKLGFAICGRVGDHGISFLVEYDGTAARTKSMLMDVANQARTLALRFGLKLHVGVSESRTGVPLPALYRDTLFAAEKALSLGLSVVRAQSRDEQASRHLRRLRMKLGESIASSANLLLPRFDQYAEAVLVHCGYRLEVSRGHLEAGFERLAEPLLANGALDQRSFDDLCAAMDHSAGQARTVLDLVASYRRLVTDLQSAIVRPVVARHERGTRAARSFMREHLGEALTLGKVARSAGFAPNYFSKLFRSSEGVTFERYLQRLRVERSKQMLRETSLSVEGVRRLCGFRTRNYFHQVFKSTVGKTPIQYRSRYSPAQDDRPAP